MVNLLTDSYWAEKYRPKTLEDVILPDDEKKKFQKYIDDQEFPHSLFVGSPGTGKSTIARILTDSIAPERFDRLLVNGSAERGIDLVRTKIIDFMKIPPTKSKIKIVFIDEVDYLTDEAFASLRNTIEDPRTNHQLMTRFLFTANFFQKIPSYIISRVLVNEFTEPDLELVVQRCQAILEAENVQYDIETVRSIVTTMYPDIRGIIGELQNSTSNGTLIKRKLYSTLDEAKAKLDLAINATTIDEAAAARLALRDVLPENLQAVDLALYVMNKYIDDALVHSIAYRYHIIAFRSFDQKHTVMAMLSDIELARFGYGM